MSVIWEKSNSLRHSDLHSIACLFVGFCLPPTHQFCLSPDVLQGPVALWGHDPTLQQGPQQQLCDVVGCAAAPLQLQQRGQGGGGLHEGCDRGATQPDSWQRYPPPALIIAHFREMNNFRFSALFALHAWIMRCTMLVVLVGRVGEHKDGRAGSAHHHSSELRPASSPLHPPRAALWCASAGETRLLFQGNNKRTLLDCQIGEKKILQQLHRPTPPPPLTYILFFLSL